MNRTVNDPKDPKPARKNDGYTEQGTTEKIVNEQEQQNVSNGEDTAGGDGKAEEESKKPVMNEDTSEQRDFSTADSIEADRKKEAGINP